MLKSLAVSLGLNVLVSLGVILSYNVLSDSYKQSYTQDIYNSSVEVGKVNVKGEFDGFCSGTVIHASVTEGVTTQQILTAKHCLEKEPKVFIQAGTTTKQCPEPVTKVTKSPVSDLALLEVVSKNLCEAKVIEVAQRDTKINFGDQVFVIGYPYGTTKTVTFGRTGMLEGVEGFKNMSKSTKFQRATPQIGPGTSGGPLLNSDGEVIGVTTGGLGGPMGMVGFVNYFTPLNELRDFIDKESKNWK